jgi:hypothetical protein
MKSTVVWDNSSISEESVPFTLWLENFYILKMEAESTSEIQVLVYQTTITSISASYSDHSGVVP